MGAPSPLPLPSPAASAALANGTHPSSHRLANGVEVVQMEMPEAPVVCLDFWCRAGSRLEKPGESGLAHFLEHMVFKGSRSLGPGEFDHRVESLGGSSNAATGFDDVHFHVLIPPEGAGEALDLLLELVLEPRLDREDFQMERQVVLEELNQSEDQPEEVAFQTLLSRACPHHAYGRAILGERRQLETHGPDGMAAFHRRSYRADGISLAMAGALGGLPLMERIEAGPLSALAATPTDPPTPEPLALVPGRHRLDLPRLEAGRLLMAWPMPAARDQDHVIGADLITTLLAEGRCSRLVKHLREELRLVESIDLDLTVLEEGSLALLEAVCDPAHLEAVEAEIHAVWQGLWDEPPWEGEWRRAQRLVANGYRFSLESAASVASLLGSNRLWGRSLPLEAPLEAIEGWSLDRLQGEILPLLDPQRAFTLVAVPA